MPHVQPTWAEAAEGARIQLQILSSSVILKAFLNNRITVRGLRIQVVARCVSRKIWVHLLHANPVTNVRICSSLRLRNGEHVTPADRGTRTGLNGTRYQNNKRRN